jgi:hypothetical protein
MGTLVGPVAKGGKRAFEKTDNIYTDALERV